MSYSPDSQQKKRIKSEIIDIVNRSWFIFVLSIISQHISAAQEVG